MMTEREQVIANLLYLKRDYLEGSDADKTIDRAIELLKQQNVVMANDNAVAIGTVHGGMAIMRAKEIVNIGKVGTFNG